MSGERSPATKALSQNITKQQECWTPGSNPGLIWLCPFSPSPVFLHLVLTAFASSGCRESPGTLFWGKMMWWEKWDCSCLPSSSSPLVASPFMSHSCEAECLFCYDERDLKCYWCMLCLLLCQLLQSCRRIFMSWQVTWMEQGSLSLITEPTPWGCFSLALKITQSWEIWRYQHCQLQDVLWQWRRHDGLQCCVLQGTKQYLIYSLDWKRMIFTVLDVKLFDHSSIQKSTIHLCELLVCCFKLPLSLHPVWVCFLDHGEAGKKSLRAEQYTCVYDTSFVNCWCHPASFFPGNTYSLHALKEIHLCCALWFTVRSDMYSISLPITCPRVPPASQLSIPQQCEDGETLPSSANVCMLPALPPWQHEFYRPRWHCPFWFRAW